MNISNASLCLFPVKTHKLSHGKETQVTIYCDKKVKVTQLFPTVCDPMDYTVHGTLQARILEWSAFPFSRWSSQPRDWTQVSHIAGGFFTSWATREAQDTRVGSLSLDLPEPGIKVGSPACRWILYPLSYQGSPYYDKSCTLGGFPHNPVVKTWPSYAGGACLIPGCGTKIPHAS